MYNPNDPVGKVTETMAKLFAVMADEIIREMGKGGGCRQKGSPALCQFKGRRH